MGGSSQASDMTETTGQGNMGQGFDQNQGNLGRGFDSTGAFLTRDYPSNERSRSCCMRSFVSPVQARRGMRLLELQY